MDGPYNVVYDGTIVSVRAAKEGSDAALSLTFYRPASSVRVTLPPLSFETLGEQLGRLMDADNRDRIGPQDVGILLYLHAEALSAAGFATSHQQTQKQPRQEELTVGDGDASMLNLIVNSSEECSRLLGQTRDHVDASAALNVIEIAKKTITLSRKLLQRIKVRLGRATTSETNLLDFISSAYHCMGVAYLQLGKKSKATTCFVLSIKVVESQTTSVMMRPETLEALQTTLLQPQDDGNSQEVVEAEVLLNLRSHAVKTLEDPINFRCTMCGECCRSADNIILSPLDMFLMSRSPSLHVLGVNSTTTLIAHEKFKLAFHFILKDGYPVCYISPVKASVSGNGHCYFAYPLISSPGDAGGVLAFDDDNDNSTSHRDESNSKALSTSEYSITEEEERRVEEKFAANSIVDDDAEDQEEDVDQNVLTSPSSAILNSYGRPALGCMLGPLHMPTMCASFPVAPELSVADFWHSRRSFWISEEKNSHLGRGMTPLAKNWQAEESFVMVKNSGCEGFTDQPAISNKTPLFSSQSRIVSATPSTSEPKDASRTVRDFLSGESDVAERWSKNAWFFGLVEELAAFLPATLPNMKQEGIRRRYVRALSTIFYNFDALPSSSRRPIKTYERLKRDVETLSWAIARATNDFLAGSHVDETGYAILLERLGVS